LACGEVGEVFCQYYCTLKPAIYTGTNPYSTIATLVSGKAVCGSDSQYLSGAVPWRRRAMMEQWGDGAMEQWSNGAMMDFMFSTFYLL